MAPRDRHDSRRPGRAAESSRAPRDGNAKQQNSNETRRQLYNNDSTYRDAIKEQARKNYRSKNPKGPNPLGSGLLAEGKQREYTKVKAVADPTLHYGVICTVPESAKALGRSVLTLKAWIREGMIPPPICKDTSRGFMHYTMQELKLIAKVLKVHFGTYDYLHKAHVTTVNSIWQSLEIYRTSEE